MKNIFKILSFLFLVNILTACSGSYSTTVSCKNELPAAEQVNVVSALKTKVTDWYMRLVYEYYEEDAGDQSRCDVKVCNKQSTMVFAKVEEYKYNEDYSDQMLYNENLYSRNFCLPIKTCPGGSQPIPSSFDVSKLFYGGSSSNPSPDPNKKYSMLDGVSYDYSSCVSEEVAGCTNPVALNYNPLATIDDESCTFEATEISGCTDSAALNYNSEATIDDGSCTFEEMEILGCTDSGALNYNSSANTDDGSCSYDMCMMNPMAPGCPGADPCLINPAAPGCMVLPPDACITDPFGLECECIHNPSNPSCI